MATRTVRGKHFAHRRFHGTDERGQRESIALTIDWLDGGIWGVSRIVNGEHRERPDEPRENEWLFRGYELVDALEAANAALSDDLTVCAADGHPLVLEPFAADELHAPLERWFFGH